MAATKKGLTRQVKAPGVKCTVKDFENNKTFSVFLSYSAQNKPFSIGSITFEPIGGYSSNGYKPLQRIPSSWYVDLN
jgi:hypothetical protein